MKLTKYFAIALLLLGLQQVVSKSVADPKLEAAKGDVQQVEPEEIGHSNEGLESVTDPNSVEGGGTELSPPTPKPKDTEDELKIPGFTRIGNYGKLVKLIMVQILQS